LEALHCIECACLSHLCLVLGSLNFWHDVGLCLDLVGERAESLGIERDQLHFVRG
jgi:hypothetical protein